MSFAAGSASSETDNKSEITKADTAANKALDGCLSLVDDVCREASLKPGGMVYVSSIVASQLLARTLFLAANQETRAKLREDLENQIVDSLNNAYRYVSQMHNESSGIIKPN